jgi:hypothetical protein
LIDREIGDRKGEGIDLWNLGLAIRELGDSVQATAYARASLDILEQIEDPNVPEMRAHLAEWLSGQPRSAKHA